MSSVDIKNVAGGMDQVVVFKLNCEYYGINVRFIESIERLSKITRVPRAKEHILGVINLRGEIIPVVSLSSLLCTESIEYTDTSRIIILQLPDYKVGFIADSVTEIAIINDSTLQSSQHLFDEDRVWIKAVLQLKDNHVMILDIDTLLNRGGV